jgi:FkbM family methyltransferase
MKYYSQIGQDRYYIERIAKFKKAGRFLDIGAYDGIHTSNTYALEKDLGWSGVCIEANPTLVTKLKENRPQATIVECAIWNAKKEIEFEISDSNHQGTAGDLLSRISGLDRNSAYFKEHFRQSRRVIKVQAKTVTQVLSELSLLPCSFDYMSLDVEGAELEALQSIDFSQVDIKFMTVEHGNRPGYVKLFKDYLEQFGFKMHRINNFDVEFEK